MWNKIFSYVCLICTVHSTAKILASSIRFNNVFRIVWPGSLLGEPRAFACFPSPMWLGWELPAPCLLNKETWAPCDLSLVVAGKVRCSDRCCRSSGQKQFRCISQASLVTDSPSFLPYWPNSEFLHVHVSHTLCYWGSQHSLLVLLHVSCKHCPRL